jgi:DNA-binding NarL/FixJ family response regulator
MAAAGVRVSAGSGRVDRPQAAKFKVWLASLRGSVLSARLDRVPLRCLIVDDSEAFLASASRLLAAQGVEVVGRATSGAEALQLAHKLEPDVALVDVQLGREDGLEVTRRLAAAAPVTRVILISSYSKDEVAELVRDSSAAGFVPKASLGADAIVELLG